MRAAALLLLLPTGCVKTAECDVTLPCESGEVCYDYVCRAVCTLDDECGGQGVCAPCRQDDAEGAIDHCFEAMSFACIPAE